MEVSVTKREAKRMAYNLAANFVADSMIISEQLPSDEADADKVIAALTEIRDSLLDRRDRLS